MIKEIIEGNEIIAEFVGAKIIAEYEDHNLFDYGILLSSKDKEIAKLLPENKRYIPSSVMEYHSSWDWLIPIYQKCFDIASNNDYFDDCFDGVLKPNLVYIAIINNDIKFLFDNIVRFISTNYKQFLTLEK